MLLFVSSLFGFAGGLAARLFDPLILPIAADFGTTVGLAALLSSAFALPMGLSQLALGPAGDTYGKERLIKVGIVALALSTAVAALAPTFSMLVGARVLTGISVGAVMPISMALIGDRFPANMRQLALSRFMAAALMGQLAGASAGGIIAAWAGWRVAVAAAAAIAAVAAAGALLYLGAERPRAQAEAPRGGAFERYRVVLSNPRSVVCFAIVFFEGMVIFGLTPFVASLLESRGLGGVREAGLVIGGVAFGGLLYAAMVPVLVKLTTRPTLMLVGGCLGGLGLMGVGLGLPWPVQVALMVLAGFGFFLLHNSVQVEVADLAPSARASAFSLHALSFLGGQAVGPLAYGAAIPAFGSGTSTVLGGLLLALSGLAGYRRLK